MKRVTMGLTPADVANTELIEKNFHTRTKAGAVGTALSIAATLTRELQVGNEILIRTRGGETHKLVFSTFHPAP